MSASPVTYSPRSGTRKLCRRRSKQVCASCGPHNLVVLLNLVVPLLAQLETGSVPEPVGCPATHGSSVAVRTRFPFRWESVKVLDGRGGAGCVDRLRRPDTWWPTSFPEFRSELNEARVCSRSCQDSLSSEAGRRAFGQYRRAQATKTRKPGLTGLLPTGVGCRETGQGVPRAGTNVRSADLTRPV